MFPRRESKQPFRPAELKAVTPEIDDPEAEKFVLNSLNTEAATNLNKLLEMYKGILQKVAPFLNVPGPQREEALGYITSIRSEAKKIINNSTGVTGFNISDPSVAKQIPFYFRTLKATDTIVDKQFPQLLLTYPESYWT